MLPWPRSSGVPTTRVARSTGTTVVPLAARTVLPSSVTTTPRVGPAPGRVIGLPARCTSRSIGTTSLRTKPELSGEPRTT